MRAHVLAGVVVGVAAGFVASAVALAQATAAPAISTPSNAVPPDAAPPLSSAAPSPPADAGTTDAPAAIPADAGASDASPAVPAAVEEVPTLRVHPAASTADAGDDDYTPTNVGFSAGIRAGYAIPLGTANGSPLTNVLLAAVPIGIDVGWFFNPHLYVGGYFIYGFGVGANYYNDACSATPDETCIATLLRFGVVAHWHFRPETHFDPWVGAGLGYDIVNTEAEDQAAGTLDQSAALHGFDLTLETGLDYKPLPYLGIGPYAELATGHYSSDSSSTSLHEWVTFGLRVRTNL